MIWALRLLGIGGKLMTWGRSVFEWLTGAWYRIVIAFLLGACIWFYVGWTSADNRATKWKRTAEQEMSLRIANEVAYKKAQQVASDMYRSKVAEYEERERNHAITTDKTIRNNVNLALAGLRARQAAERLASRPRIAETPATSSNPAGAGGMPVVDAGDARDENDVRICTENSVKLIGAREYLLTLPE